MPSLPKAASLPERWRRRWRESLRTRLLWTGLGPLLAVFLAIVAIMTVFGGRRYDDLLASNARTHLGGARNYLEQTRIRAGQQLRQQVMSEHLVERLRARGDRRELDRALAARANAAGMDILLVADADGRVIASSLPGPLTPRLPDTFVVRQAFNGVAASAFELLDKDQLDGLLPLRAPGMPATAREPGLVIAAAAHFPLSQSSPDAILYGAILVNRNDALIDHLREIAFPLGALPAGIEGANMVFVGDLAVASTTERDGGRRPTGTRAPAAIAAHVLGRGESWIGVTTMWDTQHMAGFDPVKDGGGRTIGMVYSGFPSHRFAVEKTQLLLIVTGLLGAGLVLLAGLYVAGGRQLTGRLEQVAGALSAARRGERAVRIGDAGGEDEIGKLARHFDDLLEALGAEEAAQRRAQASLAEDVALRRSLLEGNRDGLVILDAGGAVLEVNRRFCDMLGYTREELLRLHPWDWNAAMSRERLLAIVDGDGGAEFQATHRRRDGTAYEAEIGIGRVVRDGHTYLVCTVRDVGERLAAQRDLEASEARARRSEEMLNIAQAVAAIGSAELDFATMTWDCSRETRRMIGLPPAGPISQALIMSRVHPGDRERVAEALAKTAAGVDYDVEHRVLVDSRLLWVHVRVKVSRDASGRPLTAVGTVQDITDRRRLAEELDRHRHHLEDMVGARTAQLAEARDEAESANRAKSAFLANMSHEIRTPMNAIIGLAHLMSQDTVDARQRERLGKIHLAAQHLLGIINDILDLSKIEADKLRIDSIDFELAPMLDKAAALLRERAAEKGLTLACEIDARLPAFLRGDPMRLGQILLNFASNAVKFSERGAVSLRARLLDSADDVMQVRFEVSDEGIGLSTDQKAGLFRAFEQADTSTTRKYGGTGLGLAISKRLTLLMGGEIGVDSEPGRGSTFWIRVPLAAAEGAHVATGFIAESDEELMTRVRATRGGARVLLAEDNPVNQEIARDMLSRAGLAVDIVEDGESAVARTRETAYDLVLMDVNMPRMDGIAASAAIRRLADRDAVPIIALTANAFDEDRERCLAAGMSDHLGKPVNPSSLYRALLKWLPRTDAGTATPAAPAVATALPPPSAPAGDALPDIAGLDNAEGLARVGGKVRMYRRLLEVFARTHEDDIARLRDMLADGRLAEARSVAHSIKGSSANVSANRVRHHAAALETAIRDQADAAQVATLLDALDGELTPLLATLRGSDATPVPATSPAARPRAPVPA